MDLHELPFFDVKPYTHLIHSLEKNAISVDDLCTRDPKEIARICPLPSADVQKLAKDVVHALQCDVLMRMRKKRKRTGDDDAEQCEISSKKLESANPQEEAKAISTLDPHLDKALNGGFRPGFLIEVVGEAATGKTQLAMSLLLSIQLPSPQGLSKSGIYIGTENALNTRRLHQLLLHQPAYDNLEPEERPSLDHVHAIMAKDLEEQEHIIQYQLPVAIQRYGAGLVILDSVAALFRSEHGTATASQLATRAVELTALGNVLRRIAVEHQICVVVINQVSERFDDYRSSSLATTSSPAATHHLPPAVAERRQEIQSLDHQQRFFTGWGDDKGNPKREQLKTPALGLAWANQISARVVLKMESEQQEYIGGNIWRDKKKSRTLAVVFAPWAPPTNPPIRYEIAMQGLVSVPEPEKPKGTAEAVDEEHTDLLDEALWATDEDDEFP